ncbi:MAG TPA: 30S ribosomal protein S8 [Firmicutes bacterium]|jgi:small subunit ribosomal protein S8|nr:30S ribosomal protein S8 [Bacillota bacterium]HAW70370.1 30S ribosomal protein S8 [Bacillota bacterium]HAZ21076.1 30S ribosomal protein S8 [Bacillota bacterium]HBE05458.1 30S ribosomal protein S8 [Bacillota bacterium]HBG45123.1 30S ribosomal protein S8 [Bacillota bacterium]
MVMTDPIADMLTRIRNANIVRDKVVEVPASTIKSELARILKEEGYVDDYEQVNDGKQGIIRLYLKYGPGRERVITGLKRISRPGLRIYAQKHQIPKVLGGLGIAVLSTSHGIMSDKAARQEGIGGEVLCYVW